MLIITHLGLEPVAVTFIKNFAAMYAKRGPTSSATESAKFTRSRPFSAVRPTERKTDIRVIQVLLGHGKLDSTAIYTRVALKTIREIESPLALLAPPPPP